MKPRRVRFVSRLLALLLPLIVVVPLRASEAIVVHSARAEVQGNVIEFTVHAQYAADEATSEALAAGATVDVDVQAMVERQNEYWFDSVVLKRNLRRELSWNVLSQRYVLKNPASGEQETFATLEEALVAAGTVENWSVEMDSGLDPDATYEVSVRARLRRGRVPTALRTLTFWTRYWNRSEWYTWTLPR